MRILLIIALLFPSLAHAQPELQVGQEVEFDIEGITDYSCKGTISYFDLKKIILEEGYCTVTSSVLGVVPKNSTAGGLIKISELVNYRILKPAPRPEFELPCIENKGKVPVELPCEKPTHLQYSIEQITDELRFLRKWQDELKEERAELRKEIERLDDE